MSQGFGFNSYVGIGEEVTFGTAVTRTKFFEVNDDSIEGKQTLMSKPSLRGTSQDRRLQGKKDVGGSLKFPLGFEGYEKVLKHAFGTLAAVSGAGPYTHAYTLAAALPAGLTIECTKASSDIDAGTASAHIFEGCKINKMTLTQAVDEFLMASVDIIGEDWNLAAPSGAPTFPTFNGIDWSMLGTMTLAGVAIVDILKGFEFSIDNGLAGDRYLFGTRVRKPIVRNQQRKITMKLTLDYDALAEYNYFLAQTTLIAFVATWDNGLLTTSNKKFNISCPKVAVQDPGLKVSEPGPLGLELGLEAFISSAQLDEMTAYLINSNSVSQA